METGRLRGGKGGGEVANRKNKSSRFGGATHRGQPPAAKLCRVLTPSQHPSKSCCTRRADCDLSRQHRTWQKDRRRILFHSSDAWGLNELKVDSNSIWGCCLYYYLIAAANMYRNPWKMKLKECMLMHRTKQILEKLGHILRRKCPLVSFCCPLTALSQFCDLQRFLKATCRLPADQTCVAAAGSCWGQLR